jgi:multicomponent Na+:H+ antiporter subunit E
MRLISLALALFVFWLALSGHYTPALILAGLAATALCVLVAVRMGIVDGEGHPIHLVGRFVTYFPWLVCQITKSAWAVTRIVVNPALPISPTMTKVRAGQRTSLGIVTYANSITLTPGTITTGVKANVLTVHALVREGALDLEAGAMNARVTRFEGAS